jgi:hypothetical protein
MPTDLRLSQVTLYRGVYNRRRRRRGKIPQVYAKKIERVESRERKRCRTESMRDRECRFSASEAECTYYFPLCNQIFERA